MFYFFHILSRGDEDFEVEVAADIYRNDVVIEEVSYNGGPIATSEDEDRELYEAACFHAGENQRDDDGYGDYLYDLRKGWEA